MAVDLKYGGHDTLEHWFAVKMGVERARLFPVRLREATKDASALYIELEVTQSPGGGFEVATSLGGTQQRNECAADALRPWCADCVWCGAYCCQRSPSAWPRAQTVSRTPRGKHDDDLKHFERYRLPTP